MITNRLFLRKWAMVSLLMMLVSGLTAQGVSDRADKRVKAEDFIIFPWGGVSTPDFSVGAWGDMTGPADLMKDLYDCGYNTTGFIPAKYVQYAVPFRLAVILRDGEIASYPDVTPQQAEETVKAALNKIESPELRKAVYSVYITDEPSASMFPRLHLWADAIREQGFLPYINLYPSSANNERLGSEGYEAHLDEFVRICHPTYISYDKYSVFDDETLDEDGFYSNLEIVRKKALQYNIPFWNVVLSNAHFHYAEPSPATLGVQVYSTLAYGGRGIGYFTHYAREKGNYRLTPIDNYGHRTKTWEMMRDVNLKIHALAPVYCTLKSVNVFHVGNVPRNGQGIESAVHLRSISEGNLLVGEFVDPDNKPYLLIVNKDIRKSVQVKVAFKKEGKMMLISPYGRGKMRFAGEQDWLAPGAGVLLTVEYRYIHGKQKSFI
ncbi:MAG: hypothetical protein LBF85_01645 [Tannerella sp.]|jgi:hypothetical protein|nr:hypothetical protein [Tannerella sp.]